METVGAQAPRKRILAALVAALVAGCTITPRSAPPAAVYTTKDGIEQAVACALNALNTAMSKGPAPNFTHTVSVVTPGKVEEIIPQQIPPAPGELYVVRFTAEDSGDTQVLLFSTFGGVDKRVEKALEPCGKPRRAGKKSTIKPAHQ
jgi:hypothetical protein